MNPVVDKVAQAICDSRTPDCESIARWKFLGEWSRNQYRRQARAAIEALGLTADVDSIPVSGAS